MEIFNNLHVLGGDDNAEVAQASSICPPSNPVIPMVTAFASRAAANPF